MVINLREPARSNGWNPLALAREYMHAGDDEHAAAIVNDFATAMLSGENKDAKNGMFWEHTTIAMLQGLGMTLVEGIEHFPDEMVHLSMLRYLSDHLYQELRPYRPGVLDLLEHYPEDSYARTNLTVAVGGSETTFSNVKISYEAPMQKLYAQKSLMAMMSTSEIDFKKLGTEKSVLYLIMPDEKTTLHKIVSLVIKVCYEQLITLAQTMTRNMLPQRVNFLLDEFSNLPAIPDMAAMISAARSRNIKFHLIIQGMYQLSSKYGEDNAHTIKGNCGNWVFLTSRELPLLREISDLCGQDFATNERLISPSQLQRLNKDRGEALILLGRQCPYITHLADISEYVMPRSDERLPFPTITVSKIPMMTLEQIPALASPAKDEDEEEDEDDLWCN